MKYWLISEPAGDSSEPVHSIFSDQAILNTYWHYWSDKMILAGKGDERSESRCIEDWCVLNWAVEVTKETIAGVVFRENA